MEESADRQDPRVIAEVIAEACRALIQFAEAYQSIDPADTSPDQRAQLQRAYDLVQEALSCFA